MPTVRAEIICNRSPSGYGEGEISGDHSRNNITDAASKLNVSRNNPEEQASLDPFADGYDARSLLEAWRELPPRLLLSDWACYVRTTRRRADRSQVEQLVADVCTKVLGMRELQHYSSDSGCNCFLWLNASQSRQYIARMRKGAQIIGRLPCDTIVKDKQSLSHLLHEYRFNEWCEYPMHVCAGKNEDMRRNMQRICHHQYIGHHMGKCYTTSEGKCPNQNYYFCECFRMQHFIPEYFTFSHYYLMEQFLRRYETDARFQKTAWLAKPAYLTSGKGFFMIRNPREFRYFYLVRSDSCLRREGFTLQRYITRTCMLNSCKVDCRMYLLVVVLNGRRVCGFFHPGYARTAAAPYTIKPGDNPVISDNVFEHMTSTELFKLMNVTLGSEDDDDQKEQCLPFNEACELIVTGDRSRKAKKSDAERLLPFVNEDEEEGGKFDKFHMRFRFMVQAICEKLDPLVRNKPGTFQLFGLDVLIDTDAKPWLLEVNSHVATEQAYDAGQCRVISNVVTEAICLVCELLQKTVQEEELATEIEQGNCRLSNLTRAQRLLTARDAQDRLDQLQQVLEKTEISQRNRPVFLQNFFWWYETPKHRWFRPWIRPKPRQTREPEWYARMFSGLLKRKETLRRKVFKADDMARLHDNMDYFRHSFYPNELVQQMDKFETEKLQVQAEQMRAGSSGGGSKSSKAGTSSPAGTAGVSLEDAMLDNAPDLMFDDMVQL